MVPSEVIETDAVAGAMSSEPLLSDTLPDFVLIRTDQIDLGDRLRGIDPVWAKALGQVMQREGQRTPIEVCRLPGQSRWTLVSGGHRLAGAQSAGIVHLRAEIVSADRTDRKMREVSENLWRRDLDPIDRAAFIAELVSLRRAAAGLEAASFRDASVPLALKKRVDLELTETLDTMSSVYGFSDEVGEELGLSARTIRRDLLLYRGLAPSLVERLRKVRHPVATNATQLRSLAKLTPDAQRQVVDYLLIPGMSLGNPVPTTIAQALSYAKDGPAQTRAVSDPEVKRLSAFIGTFQRMSLAEKKGALEHLRLHLPAGFALTNGDQPKAQFSSQHDEYREEALDALDQAVLLIDGMLEDEILPDERAAEFEQARGKLHITRFTIAGNGIALSEGQA